MLDAIAGDVLSADADALVVPIDGTMIPPHGNLERILGNVGRQFQRRYPDAQLVEELDAQVTLPLPLGKAAAFELESAGAPFRIIVAVSTLHHADALDQTAKLAVARTAFANAIDAAARAGAKKLATAILQGGWRLTPQAAFGAMLQALLQYQGDMAVTICCLDAALAESLRGQARSLGLVG